MRLAHLETEDHFGGRYSQFKWRHLVKTCRTYSSWDVNWKDSYIDTVTKLASGENVDNILPLSSSHMKDGRGNIAPATIILPTLAMEAVKKAKGDKEKVVELFMEILKQAIIDCRDELIERFNWICAQDPRSAQFMYENKTFFSYGDEFEKEGIRGVLKHGTLAIGQLGLSEALYLLIGEDQCTPKGMALAKEIEQMFKTMCGQFKQEWHQSEIRDDYIANEMIAQISAKENRTLTDDEIKVIQKFCKSHK